MNGKLLAVAVMVCMAACLVPCEARGKDEPDKVRVQHILVGYKRSVPGKKLDRSRGEAKRLALELMRRAEEGEDFGALVEEYSDDKPPGIYLLTNTDVTPVAGSRRRSDMVTKFGDVAFGLEVGEIGMAPHHAALSPFGWHIIKRLE